LEEQKHKRNVYLRRDGRFTARCIVGVTPQGRARYKDFYGKTREEVEVKLEAIGRLYSYSKRETVQQIFRDKAPATKLDEVLEVLEMEFELRGFRPHSKQKYLGGVRKFVTAMHAENNVQVLTLLDAKNFILNQYKVCGMSASACNGYMDGIRWLFVYALGRPNDAKLFPYFRRKQRLPNILTREEVEKLLDCFDRPNYRMIAILMYSAGLRVSEAVKLRVSDICRDKMLLFIEQGKGAKDRYAVLSQRCLRELEIYWRKFRPKDYFFPSPQSGKTHITVHAIQDAFARATKKACLAQHVTPHALHHCFATHLVEANTRVYSK
jgi:integrase